MPIEIRRFGVGHRRREGPPGTVGIEGRVIHGDERGTIAELAFSRRGAIPPHSNPNLAYFVVIEGGGWVQVGDERSRVQAGDAVVWPPETDHGAWTDGTAMRALVVEYAAGGATHLPGVIDGLSLPGLPAAGARPVTRGEGRLAPSRGGAPASGLAADGDGDGEPR
jgi:quercetin dioxygenase-like cupin family protein